MTKILPAVLLLALAATVLAGGSLAAAQPPLRIAYVNWSSSEASANLICVLVRQRLRRSCELHQVSAARMWQAVAEGEADAMLSAWLPDTHRHYFERYADRLVDLGPNLEGTRTGLVVPAVRVGRQTGGRGRRNPSYVTAQSIADLAVLGDRFQHRIIGIDPEAGVMRATREAMEAYGLHDYRLIEGSEQVMTDALSEAIARQEWVVVTAWTPHWMFDRWLLRFLDDPKGVYGDTGSIHTMARRGLDRDMPRVYALLDRFHWSPAEMQRLLVWNQGDGGVDPYGKAVRWARTHPARVAEWLDSGSH